MKNGTCLFLLVGSLAGMVGSAEADADIFGLIADGNLADVLEMAKASPGVLSRHNDSGSTPILWALYHERFELAEALGSIKDPGLNFYESIALGRRGSVETMLHADPELLGRPAPDGHKPLGLAVFFRRDSVAELLMESGADVNGRSNNSLKVGPVHAAVARGNAPLLAKLLLAGADPNLPQARLVRPIHDAALAGNQHLLALLIWYGADPCLKTENGEAATLLARQAGHREVAARLEKHCEN